MQWRPPEKTSPLGTYTEELSQESLFTLLSPIPLSSWNLSDLLHVMSISTQASIPVLTTIVQKLLPSSLGQTLRLSLPQTIADTVAHRVKFRLHSMMVQALRDVVPAYSSGLIFFSPTPHPSLWLPVKLAHSDWEDWDIFWIGKKKRWMGILSNAPYWVIFIFPCFWALLLL